MIKYNTFVDFSNNPVIKAPFPEWIIGDPTVLTPDESPDQLWHLYANSLIGIRHYISNDGLKWKIRQELVMLFGYRPFIYREDKIYYLIYEKIDAIHTIPFLIKFPFYNSHLEIIFSTDLKSWSQPKTIVQPELTWHKSSTSTSNIGNPCLIKVGSTYRLYYSAGLTYIPDCRLCEPQRLGIAESKNIFGPYKFLQKSIFTDEGSSLASIFVSAIIVYPIKNGFLGLQTCILNKTQTRKSSAFIRMVKSMNGFDWKIASTPLIRPDKKWKKSHVYVGDLKTYKGEKRIYYNARNGWLFGQERIGVAIAR